MAYFSPRKKLVSIMIPTRKRVERAVKTVNSFAQRAKSQDSFEVILKIDEDDRDQLPVLAGLPNTKVIVTPRLSGYFSLHHYYSAMAAVAEGGWLWVLNDDAVCVTPDWDELFSKIEPPKGLGSSNFEWGGSPKLALLNIGDDQGKPNTIFPCIRFEAFEALGYFSGHQHVDAWLSYVFGPLNAVMDIPEIRILHENAVIDETRVETGAAQNTSFTGFFNEENQENRKQAIDVLQKLL